MKSGSANPAAVRCRAVALLFKPMLLELPLPGMHKSLPPGSLSGQICSVTPNICGILSVKLLSCHFALQLDF